MKNLNDIVIVNRNSAKSLTIADLEGKDMYTNWKNACETLRLAISNYAVADRSGKDDTKAEVTACFDAYKKILTFFNYAGADFKLRPEAQDIAAIRDVAGTYKRVKDSTTGKDFVPVGNIAFRKAVEDFIADRINKRLARTAEEIEAEKAVKREARRAKRKAEKAAKAAKAKAAKEAAEKEAKKVA